MRGPLYASIFNTIVMRTDGANPSWSLSYTYPGGASLPNGTSGFRGLTCVAQPTGTGYMLISALEGTGDIYAFQLNDMANPAIELNTLNYLSTQIGAATWNVIAAYNDMIAYPGSGTQGHPDPYHRSRNHQRAKLPVRLGAPVPEPDVPCEARQRHLRLPAHHAALRRLPDLHPHDRCVAVPWRPCRDDLCGRL